MASAAVLIQAVKKPTLNGEQSYERTLFGLKCSGRYRLRYRWELSLRWATKFDNTLRL